MGLSIHAYGPVKRNDFFKSGDGLFNNLDHDLPVT
jgi:hypothetical protein